MMKIWMVVRVLGEIVTTVGPMPPETNMSMCEAWAKREMSFIKIDADTGIDLKDVTIKCEWSVEQPRGLSRPPAEPKS
jgi:hypothetical protein